MPEVASTQPKAIKKAPTLYFIIAMKLFKGVFFTFLAIAAYRLSDNNLPEDYRRLLVWLHQYRIVHVNPEQKFWVDMAATVEHITEKRMLHVSLGTFIYSLFAWVEGVGLIYRVTWAGWLAIGESAFFIPIELYELTHQFRMGRHPNGPLLVILALNVVIVWYLYQNRSRLFRHSH